MTDTELLRQAQCGDVEAWGSLYARCLPSVWRYAVVSVGNRAVAEDVVGETMLALVKSLPTLDVDAVQLHAWLRGIVRRKVVDHIRRCTKDARLRETARHDKVASSELSTTASEALEAAEGRQQILEALEQMPDLQRIVIEWKHVEGLSVREIATQLGKTEKSIESTLFRARQEFRRLYERACADSFTNRDFPLREPETLEKSL